MSIKTSFFFPFSVENVIHRDVLTEKQVIDMLKNEIGSKFFSCEFVKANGETRKLTGKMRAHRAAEARNRTGRHRRPPADPRRITVFDVNKIENGERGHFRTIPVERLNWIKVDGKKYNIVH